MNAWIAILMNGLCVAQTAAVESAFSKCVLASETRSAFILYSKIDLFIQVLPHLSYLHITLSLLNHCTNSAACRQLRS